MLVFCEMKKTFQRCLILKFSFGKRSSFFHPIASYQMFLYLFTASGDSNSSDSIWDEIWLENTPGIVCVFCSSLIKFCYMDAYFLFQEPRQASVSIWKKLFRSRAML